MKIKLFILFVFAAVQTSYAQLGAGNILAGGQIEVNSSDNRNSFTFAPTGHYLLTDHIAVGASVGFATGRSNPGEDDYTRDNSFSLAPSIRYFHNLSEQVYLYGQGSIGFEFGGRKQYVGDTSIDVYDENTFGISVRPGLMYVVSPKVGIDFSINFISYERESRTEENLAGNDVTTENNYFQLGFNTLAPRLGLYFIF
ncbi:hypothetical protein GCM10011506_45820 [Marivirga lumbricoides]|uniref:Outer membrane protein beta-barrel domain-containing protein n=1 Tax=Marivirga lumbricoides TaxID=1046115 RepID=A0ABQ1N945_9BACT|nr:hypothetical protein GCM10011506_45820 [Marivirga lumbricoides]